MFIGGNMGRLMAAGAWGQSAMNWIGASPWRMAGAAAVGAGVIGALSPWNTTGGGITGAIKGGITGGLMGWTGGMGWGGYNAKATGLSLSRFGSMEVLSKARTGGMWGAAAGAVLGAALWSNSAPNRIQGMY